MDYCFYERTVFEFENDARQLAKEHNISMAKIEKAYILSDAFWALESDNEHDYNKFLACYKFDNEYIVLFGEQTITDFKWLGNPQNFSERLSNLFLMLLHKTDTE